MGVDEPLLDGGKVSCIAACIKKAASRRVLKKLSELVLRYSTACCMVVH